MGCAPINCKGEREVNVKDLEEFWEHNRQLRKEMTELKAQFDLMQTVLTKQNYELTGLKQRVEILQERSLGAKYEPRSIE